MPPFLLQTILSAGRRVLPGALLWAGALTALAQTAAPITFHKDFDGGSLAKVEQVASNHVLCHVEGQSDERGRNRQATWYYFRIDGARGRDLTLTLTNLVGEYNDKPGAVSMSADTIPVFSHDGEHWQHFPAMEWNAATKTATLRCRAERESLWIAHVPPYPVKRLEALLSEIKRSPHVHATEIGRSVEGRPLHLISVTESNRPAAGRKTVWLMARQHPWEAPTSFVMEGALRFITSGDPAARRLREQVNFQFVPMMGVDGVVHGKVRFNSNGYDVNRHWNDDDWRSEEFRKRMQEIWSVKKTIFEHLDAGGRIDLLVNLHNTETTEFLETQAEDEAAQALLRRFDEALAARTSFDPSRKITFAKKGISDTNSLYHQRRVPVVLMEQRISFSQKLSRRPTVEDRLRFGRELITVMAESVAP